MTDTDRLAHNAEVPRDLAALVVLAAGRAGVSVKDLRGPRQYGWLMSARRFVIAEARRHAFSYPAIGRALNRDHSTIIQAERRTR